MIIATTPEQKARIAEEVMNTPGRVSVEIKRVATRTAQQNASLHLYLEWLAKGLNEAGYDLKLVLEKRPAVSCTKDNLKESVWRPIQKSLVGKKSTTQLYKPEVSDVYEHVNRFTAEEFGVSFPFPSEKDLMGGWR